VRLLLWGTDSPVHEYTTATSSDGVIVVHTTGQIPLTSPSTALIYNLAHVAYSNGLKVEVKVSALPTAGVSRNVLVGYLPQVGTVS